MSKINKTPIETRLAIERRSAAMLPDRPTQAGFKPWEIRNALFSAIIADKGACLMGEIDRIVDETNAAIDAMRIKSGTLTVPMSRWKEEETPRAECVVKSIYTAGCAVFFMPEDDETKEQARLARLSMAINETVDGEWSDVVVFVGEGGEIPSVDLRFRYMVIPTESEEDAIVALIGVDAYGEGGGGTGSGVDEEAVKALIGKEVPEWARAKQKPTYTPEEVKARPATWTPTAEEIGARPSTWMPTAAEVGARPNTWTPTAKEVGADSAAAEIVQNHNEDGESHVDIRLDITTIRNMLAGVIGTDTGKSMRAVAALVVAEIVGNASDSFDTLEEIAAWIEAHPNDVAAMVKRITDLEAAMGGKVSKTDIINTLNSTALDKPLSAAMGAKLNTLLTGMSDELDGKATPEQVAKAISDALTGYALKDHNHDGTYAKPADIPQKLSQLAEDSTHRTVTDAEKNGWNGKADGKHDHDGVYAKPSDIPTKVSQLNNDSGFLTQHQSLAHLLPKNQGVANAGKLMMVADDGSVTYIEIADLGLSGGDIVGNFDENNDIVFNNDSLAEGEYKLYYTDADGNLKEYARAIVTRVYTITWIVDGETTTEIYAAGETPTFKGSTDKASDGQYTYTFTGWTPTMVAATADATYTAQYSQTQIVPDVKTYKITFNGDNCTSDGASSVNEGTAYTAKLTPTNGKNMVYTVSVKMGGVEQADAFNGSDTVNIANVTGVVEITARAIKNLIPLSVDASGNDYVGTNGEDGYKSGYKMSTSSGNESATSGAFCTGFMPISSGDDVIRVKNVTLSNAVSVNNFTFYKADKAKIDMTSNANGAAGAFHANIKLKTGGYYQFTFKAFDSDTPSYFRMSCGGITDQSIVTVNEEL